MKMFLLFSHNLNKEQIESAKKDLGIVEFVSLGENLQKLWSFVPPQLQDLNEYSSCFKEFLKDNAKSGDFVLISGDFGLSFIMVEYAKSINLVPIYATTKREVIEKKIDDKIIKESVFSHVIFRRY